MPNASRCLHKIAAVTLLLPLWLDASEFRGLWADAFGPGFFNADQVRKLAADCRKYNFNAVLVQMRRRGDAFYNSRYDPPTTSIATNFDALAEIIRQCHTGTPRIEVHCWLVSHYIWSADTPPPQPGHVFNQHPEYLTRDSIGQKYIGKGYFLDPGNPDANLTVYNVAKDIVSRYDIDGLHWDYCRYPNQDSGYNATAIKRFNQEFGATGEPAPNDPRFSEWRRRQVTEFLRWVNADLWEIKPKLVISAAVFANLNDSLGHRFSNWPEWNKQGIVDVCIPMNFSTNHQHLFCPRADEDLKQRWNRHVYLGQGAYMNSKEDTLFQLQYSRQKGFPGVVFYDYRHPNQGRADPDRVFEHLKQQFQPQWATTPTLPWKLTRGILKGTVTRRDTHAPVYNAVVSLRSPLLSSQRTEPHGTFAFFDLPPGTYQIRVEAGALSVTNTDLRVQAGQTTRADPTLPP
jgi:uncharacterized lipoprotein YddW (UPF0748 family)